MIIEKALKILAQPVCDHCLGRQFSQLLSGFTNVERGRAIRMVVAMAADAGNANIDASSVPGFTLRTKPSVSEAAQCSVCFGIFNELATYVKKAALQAKKAEFATFLVGTRPSSELATAEDNLWERVGIDHCEPLKAEINREAGKLIEKHIGKKFSAKRPDVVFLIDLNTNTVSMEINPLFIYGEYQKLKRGIPQTRWPSGKYKTSVEQITAKPFMKVTNGSGHKFHGAGREDIDARCLAWRPFVLEILDPKKRDINAPALAKKVGAGVKIRNARISNIEEVRKLKDAKLDKTYRALVKTSGLIKRKDLAKLSALKEINQQTPRRVLHRRSDLMRRRSVKGIKTKYINSKSFEITVKGQSGLYIKELISGDEGRTNPSVSGILGVPCVCKELDVIAVHMK
ncbi:MAG: tRNA pseudouridine(54/55) synthase Pus10 [Candidatus Aenigmarchaeota archaeon]|nr:tRNA pseudouridine(54/55) synthase Pus10 [Candidatus Aenigmarchaeota archaeon]